MRSTARPGSAQGIRVWRLREPAGAWSELRRKPTTSNKEARCRRRRRRRAAAAAASWRPLLPPPHHGQTPLIPDLFYPFTVAQRRGVHAAVAAIAAAAHASDLPKRLPSAHREPGVRRPPRVAHSPTRLGLGRALVAPLTPQQHLHARPPNQLCITNRRAAPATSITAIAWSCRPSVSHLQNLGFITSPAAAAFRLVAAPSHRTPPSPPASAASSSPLNAARRGFAHSRRRCPRAGILAPPAASRQTARRGRPAPAVASSPLAVLTSSARKLLSARHGLGNSVNPARGRRVT
jgi:hypothetical protein